MFYKLLIFSVSCPPIVIGMSTFIGNFSNTNWSQDFASFHSQIFALSRIVHVTLITEELPNPTVEDFSNDLFRTMLKFDASIRVDMKRLNQLDIPADPDFQKYLRETLIIDWEFIPNEMPEIVSAQEKQGNFNFAGNLHKISVIIAASFDSLKQYLNGSYFVSSNFRRTLHTIIVLAIDNPSTLEKDIKRILAQVWNKFHILNAFLHVLPLPYIYIYRPFKMTSNSSWGVINKYKINTNGLEIINSLDNLEGYPLKVKIFERLPTALEQIPKNMNDNSVYQYLYQFSGFGGVDGCALGQLSKRMNFTVVKINKKQRNFGIVLKSGRMTGALGYIAYDLVDLVANGMFVSDKQTDQIQFTTVISYDEISAVVPKAKKIPHWLAVFKCFHWTTWTLLTGTILISLLFWSLLADRYKIITTHRQLHVVALFLILVSAPLTSSQFKSRNVFLVACLIFNAVIIWIFQGNLVRSFAAESYYHDIDTLEQLDRSGLPISTSLNVFDYHQNSSVIENLHKKIVNKYRVSLKQAALE